MAKQIKHTWEDDFGCGCYYTCSKCGAGIEGVFPKFCSNCGEKFDGYITEDMRGKEE